MKPTEEQIECFLRRVDDSFPVPLSQKQDLHPFAKKLFEKATLCVEQVEQEILAMVAGYTDNVTDGLAYISLVATLKEAQGRHLATTLIKRFIDIAEEKQLKAVHLYAVRSNIPAMKMYQNLGFVEWHIPNETRPNDVHLIYHIRKEGNI